VRRQLKDIPVRKTALTACLATAIVSVAATTNAAAAQTTWAAKANQVCTIWKAKAKAEFGTAAPTTPKQAYLFSVKAVALEQGELSALAKIPNPTPAGTRALAAVRTDIKEIRAGIHDWQIGDKVGFVRIYNFWQHDHRPGQAFLAANANACG
jgi:hypothetical protein